MIILSALLLIHYFPGLATLVWSLALAGGLVWLALTARKYQRYHRQERAKVALALADEHEFRAYENAVAAARTAAAPGPDFETQLALLQQKHRLMLDRRFGPH